MMNSFVVFASVVCLASASSKVVRSVPTISNSLVNLGKMDISLYFNGKPGQEMLAASNKVVLPSPMARTRPMEALPCPCSAFKSSKDSLLSDPSEIINKVLRSNDLFKDPTSTLCCDSHEQIQESTVVFELSPNRAPITINNRNTNPYPKLPFPIQKLLSGPSMRPKAMEIFLFPKRKDIMNMDVMKSVAKPPKEIPEIQVVGDKEIKPLNDRANEGASVKKDLTSLLEKKETNAPQDESLKEVPTTTFVSNAL